MRPARLAGFPHLHLSLSLGEALRSVRDERGTNDGQGFVGDFERTLLLLLLLDGYNLQHLHRNLLDGRQTLFFSEELLEGFQLLERESACEILCHSTVKQNKRVTYSQIRSIVSRRGGGRAVVASSMIDLGLD